MIGSIAPEVEQMYGEIFAKYLADPQNLFVISSDFCHWGSRFRYTYYDKSAGPIWKSIEKLDKQVRVAWWCADYATDIDLILGHGPDRATQSRRVQRVPSAVPKHDLRPPSNRSLHAGHRSAKKAKPSAEL